MIIFDSEGNVYPRPILIYMLLFGVDADQQSNRVNQIALHQWRVLTVDRDQRR